MVPTTRLRGHERKGRDDIWDAHNPVIPGPGGNLEDRAFGCSLSFSPQSLDLPGSASQPRNDRVKESGGMTIVLTQKNAEFIRCGFDLNFGL